MATATLQKHVALKWDKPFYYQAVETGLFDGRHIDLTEGEIIEMSPMGSLHASAIMLAEDALRAAFASDQYRIRVQMDFDIPGDTMLEPDIAVVLGKPRDFRQAHPRYADLIVEVAESSLGFDRNVKAKLYARSGVPEYWIVNLVDGNLEIYRSPSANAPHAYTQTAVIGPDDTVIPIGAPDAAITVADLLP